MVFMPSPEFAEKRKCKCIPTIPRGEDSDEEKLLESQFTSDEEIDSEPEGYGKMND